MAIKLFDPTFMGTWTKLPGSPIWQFLLPEDKLRMRVMWRDTSLFGSLMKDIERWTASSTPTIHSVVAGGFQTTHSFDGYAFPGKGEPVRGDGGAGDLGYVVYKESTPAGQPSWEFGTGQPAATSGPSPYDAGLSGVVPLVVKGADQKSHRRVQSAADARPGRTILARKGEDKLIGVFVQEHGKAGGFNLPDWVDALVAAGAVDAMNLDGSDSVFVYGTRTWLYKDALSSAKNHFHRSATGFSGKGP
ncbi:MAG: phosphodiester glycosidase family protein [Gemmataceae bacterium]